MEIRFTKKIGWIFLVMFSLSIKRCDIGILRFFLLRCDSTGNQISDTRDRLACPSVCHNASPALCARVQRHELPARAVGDDYPLGCCHVKVRPMGLSGSVECSTAASRA